MPGNIWTALGAALQGGARAHAALSAQEEEDKVRQAQVAMDRQRMAMSERQQSGEEQDRKLRIIQNAIEGADPNQEFDPAMYDEAKKFGLGGRFEQKPVAKDIQLGPSGINVGTSVDTMTNPNDHLGAFRRRSPKEQVDQKQLDFLNAVGDPNDKTLGMTPEMRQRLQIAMQSGVQGTELNTVLGMPGAGKTTPNTSALVQTIMAKPSVYASMPKPLQEKLAEPLAEAGFKFDIPVAGSGVPSEYTAERNKRVLDSVGELEDSISNWTTGWGAKFLKDIPATEAKAFAGKLKTLTSNIAFNELTEMRAASKTGGALGQVSDKESELLSSTLAALDQEQDGDTLRTQLQKVRESIERWQNAKRQFGGEAPGESEQDTTETKPSSRTAGSVIPQMTDGFRPEKPTGRPTATPAAFGNSTPQMKSGAFPIAQGKTAGNTGAAPSGDAALINQIARQTGVAPTEVAKRLRAAGRIQ